MLNSSTNPKRNHEIEKIAKIIEVDLTMPTL